VFAAEFKEKEARLEPEKRPPVFQDFPQVAATELPADWRSCREGVTV